MGVNEMSLLTGAEQANVVRGIRPCEPGLKAKLARRSFASHLYVLHVSQTLSQSTSSVSMCCTT